MKTHRWVSLLAFLALFGGTTKSFAKSKKPIISLIYPLNGKGDKSFTDSAARAKPEAKRLFGVDLQEIEPKNNDEIAKRIDQAVAASSTMIIGIGFRFEQFIKEAAQRHPKVHFGIIDDEIKAPNVASILFKEHEGGYLAGFVAARKSASKTIGFIGGAAIPPVERFLAGYTQGALAGYPKHVLKSEFLGAYDDHVFNNPTKAKQVARQQYAAGVDVIYAVAGGSNLGVFEAAREVKHFAIGVDSNQNAIEEGYILTSVVKRIDLAVLKLIEVEVKNKFKARTQWLGLKEGAVELAFDDIAKKLLSKKLRTDVEKIRKKIVSGAVKVEESL